ncbi:MAG: hypothetical protein Q4D19_11170 [Lautropia sp.]|nr:hypothetical protein [Lautropia sp.]
MKIKQVFAILLLIVGSPSWGEHGVDARLPPSEQAVPRGAFEQPRSGREMVEAQKNIGDGFENLGVSEYARVVEFILDGDIVDEIPVEIEVLDGSDHIEAPVVSEGWLRLASLSDPGRDVEVRMRLRQGSTEKKVKLTLESSHHTDEVFEMLGKDDDGELIPALPLKVKGLLDGVQLTKQGMEFSVEKPFVIDADSASVAVFSRVHNDVLSEFTKEFVQNSDGSLALSGKSWKEFYEKLIPGYYDFYVGFSDKNSDDSRGWEVYTFKAIASLEGEIVDMSAAGKDSPFHLVGRKIAVRGISANNGIRKVVVIDKNRRFRVENLPPGTYEATLLDTTGDSYAFSHFSVERNSEKVFLKMEYFGKEGIPPVGQGAAQG